MEEVDFFSKMNHLMIDIETLGDEPGSVIVSIAAVPFRFEDAETLEPFYANISIDSSLRKGLHINESTLRWWMTHVRSKEARERIFDNPQPLRDVMLNFRNWVKLFGPDVFVWSKGAGFDIPMLKSSFKAVNVIVPWKFSNERCVRTIAAIDADIRKSAESVNTIKHFPVHDCNVQIKYVREICIKHHLLGLFL